MTTSPGLGSAVLGIGATRRLVRMIPWRDKTPLISPSDTFSSLERGEGTRRAATDGVSDASAVALLTAGSCHALPVALAAVVACSSRRAGRTGLGRPAEPLHRAHRD